MLTYKLGDDAELRLLEEHDAEALYHLIDRNRDFLREWLPFPDFVTGPEGTLDFIRTTRRQVADNQGLQCVIVCEGEPAGMVGFHRINWMNKSTTLGYWLAEDCNGRGLMTRAVRAMVEHAFTGWKLNKVEIRVATENRKSQAIPERLGFVKEGVLRQNELLNGEYVDHIAYSMLAEEWK